MKAAFSLAAEALAAQFSRRQVPRVAIVGAGVAGLAAATELGKRVRAANGKSSRTAAVPPQSLDIVLLEASSRVGGRVRTVVAAGEAYDTGATWVHGRSREQNPFLEFCDFAPPYLKEKSEQSSTPAGRRGTSWVRGETGEEVANGAAVRTFTRAYDEALDECLRIAEGQHLRGFPPGTQLPEDVASAVEMLVSPTVSSAAADTRDLAASAFRWRQLMECSISGCNSVDELSLSAWGECEEIPGAKNATRKWQGGYSALVDAATSRLPPGVDIRLNCPVSRIAWSAECDSRGEEETVLLQVRGEDGALQDIRAEHVIFTGSLGVLKNTVAADDGSSIFAPPLPEAKASAVEKLGFGTVDKLLLTYDKPWWQDAPWENLHILWASPEGGGGSASGSSSLPSWAHAVYGFRPSPREQGLECWLSGDNARAAEQCSDEEVRAVLSSLVQRCALTAKPPPAASGLVRSAWFSDPLFRGSYSYVPCGASGDDIDELAKPEGDKCRLVLAGEHTHRNFYSYVHGAWLSGERAAAQVAACYGL
eukprot:TRINITY_DN18456_c0_g2_i2.p1 TRINITY_DN18456_c0_g2~~TRINITY_DN18456_c0_g2_i2.p1  ORF type:complete len:597 (-),score=128.61 TRINITY_DN18456_c0_g2_i2:189-1796(-)